MNICVCHCRYIHKYLRMPLSIYIEAQSFIRLLAPLYIYIYIYTKPVGQRPKTVYTHNRHKFTFYI